MWTKLLSLLPAIAFPVLCINCLTNNGPLIQAGVRGFAETAVKAAGLNEIRVLADGRDVTLQGYVESDVAKAKAETAARLAAGVRSVNNELVVVTQSAVQSKLNEILLRKKIEFETAKDVLLPSSVPVLEEALGVLRQAPNLKVAIGGHTDNAGKAEDNQKLSERRAKAVADWFAAKGIGRERLSSAGFGSSKPIANNNTGQGKATNRRVEIVASGGTN